MRPWKVLQLVCATPLARSAPQRDRRATRLLLREAQAYLGPALAALMVAARRQIEKAPGPTVGRCFRRALLPRAATTLSAAAPV